MGADIRARAGADRQSPTAPRARRVLVAHERRERLAALAFDLASAGFAVSTATTGGEAAVALRQYPPDVLLVSAELPDIPGVELVRRSRALAESRDIAMLVILGPGVTAGDDARVRAFEVGADDCLPDNVNARELVLRVGSLTRRYASWRLPDDEVLRVGPVVLDRATRDTFVAGRFISLTPTEFALLSVLLAHPDRTLTRSQLYARVWRTDPQLAVRAIETHVYRLRRKLGDAGRLLESVPRRGYRFRRPDPDVPAAPDADAAYDSAPDDELPPGAES